jgi:hypothetical protein
MHIEWSGLNDRRIAITALTKTQLWSWYSIALCLSTLFVSEMKDRDRHVSNPIDGLAGAGLRLPSGMRVQFDL